MEVGALQQRRILRNTHFSKTLLRNTLLMKKTQMDFSSDFQNLTQCTDCDFCHFITFLT